jgi:zinc protease
MNKLFFKSILIPAVLVICMHTAAVGQSSAVEFTVNGLKVILRQTQKETLVMSMYFKGGSTNYTAANAGIESLALSGILDCGNSTYAATEFNDKTDEFGLHLSGNAANDYGVIKLSCISRYANEAWKLFSSAISSPVFDEQKFNLLKEQKINDLKGALSNPDDRLENLAKEIAFAKTSYAINPEGTVQTLSALTRDEVKDYYYNILLNRNRMFLVVAGNISKEDLQTKVSNAFSAVPTKSYTASSQINNLFVSEDYKIESRPLATNYIAGIINAPELSSTDYPAYRIGVILVNSGMYDIIRTSKQLSYAPSATLTEGNIPYVTLYASTTQPEETVKAMRTILLFVKRNTFNEKVINNVRKSIVDGYKKRQEVMTEIVDYLGLAEIAGDWKMAENLPERMNNVSNNEVTTVMTKYIQNIKWAYIGNAKQAENIFR